MDKQVSNLKLLNDGDIQFKTGRKETPHNRVISLNPDYVEFVVNKRYIVCMDTEDYFKFGLWANPMHMSHADINVGVISVENGYSHRSVAGLVMLATDKQRVGYRDGDRFNLRKSNLRILGKHEEEVTES